jgi:hypothetical protein
MNTPRTQPVARRLFNLLLVLGLLSSLFAFQGASPASAQVEEPESIVENIFGSLGIGVIRPYMGV